MPSSQSFTPDTFSAIPPNRAQDAPGCIFIFDIDIPGGLIQQRAFKCECWKSSIATSYRIEFTRASKRQLDKLDAAIKNRIDRSFRQLVRDKQLIVNRRTQLIIPRLHASL